MNLKNQYSRSSFSVIMIFLCLMIIGIGLVPLLTIQLNPSPETHNLSVSYSWPGVSARIVEQEVTSKLEGLFSGVRGIRNISSVSSKEYGVINLGFKKNANRDAIRFEIASLIRQSYPELPAGVSYPQLSLDISGERTGPVMTYTINASASPYYIKKYAENNILPLLAKIPGVSEVQFYGATPYEIDIEFQTNSIRELGVTGSDIAQGINTYFGKGLIGKGSYQQPEKDYVTELSLQIQQNISGDIVWDKIPIKKVNDRIVYLGDLATTRYREQVPSSYNRINGLNTINVVIYPDKDINTISLAKSIHKKMVAIKQQLPPGYSILLASDSTEYLSKEINKITFRAALSLCIVLVLVLVASQQFRYLLIVAISIISNILISCIFFYLFNVELQFYSIAGITISLGIIVGNSIMMINHIRTTGNKKIFLAICAATLVTIAALGVIFFLPEKQKANLTDFAIVVMINLTVSFAVSFYFVPALMEKIRLGPRKNKRTRWMVRITGMYGRVIAFNKRWKWGFIILLILGFGVPVHWLPNEVKGDGRWELLYKQTLGNEFFLTNVKPTMSKILGGSLRLFAENIFTKSYQADPSETLLHVRGSMPDGCTVHQLNETIEAMERFISQFDEVAMFQTTVSSYNNSDITIRFKPEHEWTSFPYFLKSELESKAINLGGADWSVYGVGQGFSNAIHEGYKGNSILLEGYNYEQLYRYAEALKNNLLENPRIKEVDITGSERWHASPADEFFIEFNNEQLALNKVSIVDFYTAIKDQAYRNELNAVYTNEEMHRVFLTSDMHSLFNVWDFNNGPLKIDNGLLKLGRLGSIEKRQTGNTIHKNNQQYRLTVAYDFIGSHVLASLVQKQHIEEIRTILPIGYFIKGGNYGGWDKDDKSQYYFILLVVVAIYFICAILLESLVQPLAVIAMIPVSFIGAFLTFYLFDINFDQGGFASFILLSGLAVTAGLYIVNDYNNFRTGKSRRNLDIYLKSFNHKIFPIVLAMLSTVLGLVPFVIQGQNEVFWFAFAAGAIGGLIFSLVAILIYLPLFLPILNRKDYQLHA